MSAESEPRQPRSRGGGPTAILTRITHTVTHESSVRRACKPWCSPPLLGDARHHQADAAAIRAVFNEIRVAPAVPGSRRQREGASQCAPGPPRPELWAEAARYGDADSGQGRHAAGEGAQGTAQGGVARKLKKR